MPATFYKIPGQATSPRAKTNWTNLSKGVAPDRITIASYGADAGVYGETTESCLAKNRRVQLLVKERHAKEAGRRFSI